MKEPREFELIFTNHFEISAVALKSKEAEVYPNEKIHVREVLPGQITITREEFIKICKKANRLDPSAEGEYIWSYVERLIFGVDNG